MSRVRADRYTDKTGTGAPLFPNGAQVTGVITATTFKGALEGNVDSVGLITARSGMEISGIVTARPGLAVTYYGDGSNLTGINISASSASDWRDNSLF